MKKSFLKRCLAAALSVLILTSSFAAVSAAALSDVASHPAKEAIETLYQAGAVSGYPDGTFKPDRAVSRAEFATILNRYFEFNKANGEPFADVAEDAWYAKELLIAKAAGYMAGVGENRCEPDANITRQDAFVMVAGLYGLSSAKEMGYSDKASISEYAKAAVSALTEKGVLSGETIRPQDYITRAEAATLLVAAVDALGKPDPKITALNVSDITMKDIFDEKTNTASVQSDIYGVLLKAEAAAAVTVTAEKTTYDDEGNLTYTAGEPIAYNEDLGGYIVCLSQAYADYDAEYVQTVTIRAEVADKVEEKNVTIKRQCDKAYHDLFQQKSYAFDMGDAGTLDLSYNVYFPSDFDESKQYPVVLVLHGSGQMEFMEGYSSLDMIVKRNQAALAWAKDSEAGINQCIVVAPQLSPYKVSDQYMWGGGDSLHTFGLAAYDLLEKEFIAKDYVDEDKIYVTGLSLGGVGTYAMIASHPETFAGAVIACGATYEDWYGYDYSKLEPLSGNIYLTHAQGDPEVDYSFYEQSVAGLTAAGVDFETKTWTAEEIFYPHAHYSWTPTYADETIRNWLFDQVR